MKRARALFYVCAGIFLFALSYHLGAHNAGAQSGSIRWVGDNYVVANGTLWQCDVNSGWRLAFANCDTRPVPIPADAIAGAWGTCNSDGGAGIISFGGDAWIYAGNLGGWVHVGVVPGGAAAVHNTLGQLKDRYR